MAPFRQAKSLSVGYSVPLALVYILLVQLQLFFSIASGHALLAKQNNGGEKVHLPGRYSLEKQLLDSEVKIQPKTEKKNKFVEDFEGKEKMDSQENDAFHSQHEFNDWKEVTLLLHTPVTNNLKLIIGNRELNFRMVSTEAIVAPGAQLIRDSVSAPEPLLAKRSCHFDLFDGPERVGSLFICHALGHHMMLMLDHSVLDIIPKKALAVSGSENTLFSPETITVPHHVSVVDQSFDPEQDDTFPLHVARNYVGSSELNNLPGMDSSGRNFRKREDVERRPMKMERSDGPNEVENRLLKPRSRRSLDKDPLQTQGLEDLLKDELLKFDEGLSFSSSLEDEVEKKGKRRYQLPLIVEIALFLDEKVLANLNSFYSEEQLIDLILSLMNNVQAFFHQTSLGRRVDLKITQLSLLTKQPEDLPTHQGHRLKLLNSFCRYQRARIQKDASSPLNWDLAVYLSGLDLVAKTETGNISDVTMGLAFTDGICNPDRACIISEFGTMNAFGKPFPTAGALASLILAHEIGHSLGLRHDGSNNNCSQNYMMAGGRGPRGGTTWSSCSKKDIALQRGPCLRNIDRASIFSEASKKQLAGQMFDAIAQCQLFLRDHDATLTWPSNLRDLCRSVQCSSPHRLKTYLAGPAFEGTYCGERRWCKEGSCVPWTPSDNVTVVVGGRGNWEESPCTSACLEGGTGWRESRQYCDNPKPRNSDQGCITTTYKTDFCDDRQVCGGGHRTDIDTALNELCSKVSERYPDALPVGLQLDHRPTEPWRACILYCRLRSNNTQIWTPRYLFQDDPSVPTHLPPGAPCHVDPDGTTYRCFHRTCIPHTDDFFVPQHRDLAGLFEYRDPPSLDDIVIHAGPPANVGEGNEDYPLFDLDDLF